ncbi:gamma-aminobutyric acid type B receptor subunit 2-like [Glandiceps talaboti]
MYGEVGNNETNEIELAIAGLMPIWTPNGGWNAAGVVPAIEMAIKDVNSRPGLLDGYRLKLYLEDDHCDPGMATNLLYKHLINEPTKLMILGSGCSIASVPVANAAHYFNLLQASFSTSGELSEKGRFPLFFRVVQSDLGLNPPYLALLRHFGWKRVAVLYHDTLFFAKGKDNLLEILSEDGVQVVVSESFNDYPVHQVESIKKNDVRIILVMGYEGKTRRAFCEGYKQGVYGAKYAWHIVSGWYEEDWYMINDTDCSPNQMAEAVDGTISTFQMLMDFTNATTIAGSDVDVYYQRYLDWPSTAIHGTNEWATPGYDSVWVVALALNNSREEIEKQEILDENGTFIRYKRLEDFSYSDKEMSGVFKDAMLKVKFHGVTGPFQFGQNRERQGIVLVHQTQEGRRAMVALYVDATASLDFNEDTPFQWKGDGPPVDGLRWHIRDLRIVPYLFYAACALASFGLLLSVIFLGVNIAFRKHGYIRMSSPRLNNMIILGAMMAYLSVIFFGLDGNTVPKYNSIFCSLDTWILVVSFTLGFGAMFAKTWRVYKIFTNKIHKRQALHDTHLMGFVGILLLIDIVILATWQVIDPWVMVIKNLTTEITGDDAVVLRMETCESNYTYYWLGAIYAIKGLLLLFGCFLAYETRNVCVDGLNDSKQICVSVYNIVVLCVLGLTVNLAVQNNPTLTFGFTTSIIILSTTFTICLLFVPKVKVIMADPSGEELKRKRLREGLSVKGSMDGMRKQDSDMSMDTTTEELTAKVATLKWKLCEKDDEIQKLTQEINISQKTAGNTALVQDANTPALNVNKEFCSKEVYVNLGSADDVKDVTDVGIQVEEEKLQMRSFVASEDLKQIVKKRRIPEKCKLVFVNLGYSGDEETDANNVIYV